MNNYRRLHALIGLQVSGAAVLSIISGIPYFNPIFATSAIGKTVKFWVWLVFHHNNPLVFSSVNFSKLAGSLGSANLTSIPSCLNVLAN